MNYDEAVAGIDAKERQEILNDQRLSNDQIGSYDEAVSGIDSKINERQELLNDEIRNFDTNKQTSIALLRRFSRHCAALTESDAWSAIHKEINRKVVELHIDDQAIKDELANRFGYLDSPAELLQMLGNNSDSIFRNEESRRPRMRPGSRSYIRRTYE